MEVLEVTADWEEAEVRWIARFKALGAGLVNGTAGGLDMTHLPPEFVKKPWVAGRGIKSPSHFAFFGATGQLRSDESRYRWEHMKKALNRLSDAERCKFEIWAYGQFRPALRRKLNKWLDVAAPKMAKCLEESLNARA